MTIKPAVPQFETETEEAAWWYEHREEHDELLETSINHKTALHLRHVLWKRGLVLEGLKEVTIRLEESDVERARQQAAGMGIDCHEYLGKLLHEALWN